MNTHLKITPVALVLGTLAAGTATFAITNQPKNVMHQYAAIVRGHISPHHAVVKTAMSEQGTEETKSKEEDDAAGDANLIATITPAQAISSALAAYPGDTATQKPELEEENGISVYGIGVTAADGKILDVKVDANSGRALKGDSGDESETSDEADDK